MFEYSDFDVGFWIKFVLISLVLVILPVWFFKLADLSFLYKTLFTLAGFAGVWIALNGKTIKYGKNHR